MRIFQLSSATHQKLTMMVRPCRCVLWGSLTKIKLLLKMTKRMKLASSWLELCWWITRTISRHLHHVCPQAKSRPFMTIWTGSCTSTRFTSSAWTSCMISSSPSHSSWGTSWSFAASLVSMNNLSMLICIRTRNLRSVIYVSFTTDLQLFLQMWCIIHGRRKGWETRAERSCTPSPSPTPWLQKPLQSLRLR